jgi:predicted GNAT family acetyltransferase
MKYQVKADKFLALTDQQEVAGYILFKEHDGVTTLASTFVEPKFRGQNVAAALVANFVAYAKKEKLQLKLECSYAKKVFAQNPDYQKLLVK